MFKALPRVVLSLPILSMLLAGCASNETRPTFEQPGSSPTETAGPFAAPSSPPATTTTEMAPPFDTCASATVEATRAQLPVDIIWVVDNSSSMAPAVAEVQAGLNTFADLIGTKGLDYRVILLSLRGTAPVSVGGRTRHPVCVPPPLGGEECANSALFTHAAVDIQSTQPLEQILGTLDQTTGYAAGATRGGEPWAQALRPQATKSFVIVTDDNSRFPAVSFEGFPGGDSPYTSGLVLPPGILHSSRGGSFGSYVFSGIYGWGSTLDPSIRCTYGDGSKPTASGSEYSALVAKTGGVRAQICDGSAAWSAFFDAVATAVVRTSRLACTLPIPRPDAGSLDPDLVNVQVSGAGTPASSVPRVADLQACGGLPGWYYDVPAAPTTVSLCPKSCDDAQANAGAELPKVEVLFGCATVVR